MKRVFIVCMALATVALLLPGQASAQSLGLHDVNNNGCVACHTVHESQGVDAPLWGHIPSVSSFDPYPSGGTMDATPLAPVAGTVSFLCLSCHDGVTIVADTAAILQETAGDTIIGTDLSKNHPIGFVYTTASDTDLEIIVPNDLTEVNALIPLFGATGTLECASCHDPHDDTINPFLRVATTNSDLCQQCHSK